MWAVYVRLTDLQRPTAPDQPPPILAQFIKEGVSTAGVTFAAASPRYFGIGAQVKWLQLITERVAKAFFFHSEEPLRTIDGVPQIKMLGANWYQNAVFTPPTSPRWRLTLKLLMSRSVRPSLVVSAT